MIAVERAFEQAPVSPWLTPARAIRDRAHGRPTHGRPTPGRPMGALPGGKRLTSWHEIGHLPSLHKPNTSSQAEYIEHHRIRLVAQFAGSPPCAGRKGPAPL